MQVSLRLNSRDAVRGIRRLREGARTAIPRALNRSIRSARVVMRREVARDMHLKQARVDRELRITDATPAKHEATLGATRRRIPLAEFGATGPMPSRGKGRGVTARTETRRYPNAFLAVVGNGHRGAFIRKRVPSNRAGKPRSSPQLPISELFGASIGHVFQKYVPVGTARGVEQLRKNLASELRFALRKGA